MSQTLDNLSYTWNNAGTTFTGIKYNATDTASAAGSLLMDLQVGGVSKASIHKSGQFTSAFNGVAFKISISGQPEIGIGRNGSYGTLNLYGSGVVNPTATVGSNHLSLNSTAALSWPIGDADLVILRDAANTLAQRNSTNAQTFRLYSTYTDSSNYTRLKIGFASGNCEIKPENAGTGGAALLHISGLPTSNPGPGILWNDAGTVKVGT